MVSKLVEVDKGGGYYWKIFSSGKISFNTLRNALQEQKANYKKHWKSAVKKKIIRGS